MALPLSNTFETGVADETVLNGNSGNGSAGNAFDDVTTGGGTIKFDTAQAAHGTLSARFDTSTARTQVAWLASMGTQTQIWGRCYFFKATAPTNDFWVIRFEGSGGTNAILALGGGLTVFDSVFTSGGAGVSLTYNQWYRFEFHLLCSATVGVIEAKVFAADATSPLGTGTITNANTQTDVTAVNFGNPADTIDAATFWLDDLQVNATGYPGPSVVPANLANISILSAVGF